MASKKKPAVKYTDRDLDSIRESLDRLAQTYTPQINTDKSVANFATQLFDSVAYIGDVLSFNLDYYVNETFRDTAIQSDNLIRHGEQAGFKYSPNPSSMGIATFYIQVPVNTAGTGPDLSLAPVLRRGSEFSSSGGVGFILIEDVNFADPNNETRVSVQNSTSGAPERFAIRAYGQVISGEARRETITVGDVRKYRRIRLETKNITEVMSVIDAQGNEWFEVPYLTQDVVFKPIVNRDSSTNDLVRNILRPFPVPRRFVVRQSRGFTEIQFGHGASDSIDGSRPTEPSNVVVNMYAKPYVSDDSFDPDKLLSNDKLGVAPANTDLEILLRVNTANNVNVAVGQLNRVDNPIVDFGGSRTEISSAEVTDIITSLQVANDQEIVGDVTFPTAEELRLRMEGAYAAQNRAVTRQDYISVAYKMPPAFGAIKRVSVEQDEDSFRRNLNMYVVAEGADTKFARANLLLKENLKNWLAQYKMVGDTIDIIDATIVNLGIEFVAVGEVGFDRSATKSAIVSKLTREFAVPFDIGAPLSISRIYKVINSVRGVTDTIDVKIVTKKGGLYSDSRFSVRNAISADGRMVHCPRDTVFEIKYPNIDIQGVVR